MPKDDKISAPATYSDAGHIRLRLTPEGTQNSASPQGPGTTRGPNIDVPMKRLELTYESDDQLILRAVGKHLGEQLDYFVGCTIDRSEPPHITVRRA